MRGVVLCIFVLPLTVFAATVLNSFDAPDTGISGLAWGDGYLWALDGTTQYVYQLDPADGDVVSSFYVRDDTPSYNPVATGLAWGGSILYAPMTYASSYGKVYKYNQSGVLQGTFDSFC